VGVLKGMVMSPLLLEKLGYVLWEGLVLLCVITGSLGFVMLRRKWSGRPAFSKKDRDLLFNTPPAAVNPPKLCLRFAMAVFLFCCIGALDMFVFAPLGAAILSLSLLLSCAGIVNITLL
jgi:hypothetical protein